MRIHYDDGTVRLRDSVMMDVLSLKDRLRADDIAEINASHGWTPEQALRYGYAASNECVTVVYHFKPVAMFGVVPDPQLENVGAVWMLAADSFYGMRRTFLRLSPIMIRSLLALRPVLYNYCDARNAKALRWLRWCGAKLKDPIPYGVKGLPFYFFSLERKPSRV